jgi:hypothetical protein
LIPLEDLESAPCDSGRSRSFRFIAGYHSRPT